MGPATPTGTWLWKKRLVFSTSKCRVDGKGLTPRVHPHLARSRCDDDLVDLLAVVQATTCLTVKGRVCPRHVPDLQRRLPQQLCTVVRSLWRGEALRDSLQMPGSLQGFPLKEKTSHPALKDKERSTDSAVTTGVPVQEATRPRPRSCTHHTQHTPYCMSYSSNS